jgi:hypothetical protein
MNKRILVVSAGLLALVVFALGVFFYTQQQAQQVAVTGHTRREYSRATAAVAGPALTGIRLNSPEETRTFRPGGAGGRVLRPGVTPLAAAFQPPRPPTPGR